MSYVPNNTSVYLRAFAGFMAGITAPAKTDTNAADFSFYAQMADAYSQQLDTSWGVGTPTSFELYCIAQASEAVWENSSVLPANAAVLPGAYTQVAQSVIARVQQGNTQIVSQGIDPNENGITIPALEGSLTAVALSTPVTLTAGVPVTIAAMDLTSKASGYFVVGFTTDYEASTADVHTWALEYSAGITAGYAGGSTANTTSAAARYLQGASITGGTGGTGPTVFSESGVSVGAGTQQGPGGSSLFKVNPGQRVGVTLLVQASGGSQVQAGTVSFFAYELPAAAV